MYARKLDFVISEAQRQFNNTHTHTQIVQANSYISNKNNKETNSLTDRERGSNRKKYAKAIIQAYYMRLVGSCRTI